MKHLLASGSNVFNIKSAVSMSAKTTAVQNLRGLKEPIVPQNVFYIASADEHVRVLHQQD